LLKCFAPLLPRRRKEEEEIHRQLAEIERRKAEEAERKVKQLLNLLMLNCIGFPILLSSC